MALGRALLGAFAHPQDRKTRSSLQLVCNVLGGRGVERTDLFPFGALDVVVDGPG